MTDPALRKICPNSGEKCDCPKGQCNGMVVEYKRYSETSHEHDAQQLAVYQHAADQLQMGPDEQEARSLKYSACAQVLLLSSGKFALFGPYSMQDGIPLLAIDTWAGLEPHVRAYRQVAEDAYQQEKLAEEQRRKGSAAKAAADYDNLFGEES